MLCIAIENKCMNDKQEVENSSGQRIRRVDSKSKFIATIEPKAPNDNIIHLQ